jgi:uncharacterized membrane protein YeaQ/YmgE (transglycosylase-associated protein family)
MGVLSWTLAGLACGITVAILSPRSRRLAAGWLAAVSLGILGALLGGVVATVVGFGGLAVYDPRSLLVATLGATLLLLTWRLRRRAQVGVSPLP